MNNNRRLIEDFLPMTSIDLHPVAYLIEFCS
jgi:hypothetical protein